MQIGTFSKKFEKVTIYQESDVHKIEQNILKLVT